MNAREISLTAMLSAMIFVFASIRMILPIPLGIITLYIFRRFERNAVRSLFMSSLLHLFFLMFVMFDVYTMAMWGVSVLDNFVAAKMITNDFFTFKNLTMFNVGGIAALPHIFFVMVIIWNSLLEASMELPIFITVLIRGLIVYMWYGIITLIGFKIVKRILDKYMIKAEMFDQIIGGINV